MNGIKPVWTSALRGRALRPFLDALYPPPTGQHCRRVIVCRCEEVTAAQIRSVAKVSGAGSQCGEGCDPLRKWDLPRPAMRLFGSGAGRGSARNPASRRSLLQHSPTAQSL
ncbi:hypothetical protein F2981_32865 (plasmid) [Sinorhizobium meliloti]|nr:hypothetical protein [Sinorhizobium meliloti]